MNDTQWYALRVRSNCEKVVASSLRGKGFSEFLPLYRKPVRNRRTVAQVELPLFPGYVFGEFDVNRRLPVLTIPGVVHIVGIGQTPEPVDKAELDAIERFVVSGKLIEPWPFLKVGETVVVEHGPFSEMEGVLVQLKSSYRLVISLSLLQRSVAVEIDRDCVRPVQRRVMSAGAAPYWTHSRVG